MSNNNKEIDLSKFILFIWTDKWKILIISFLMMIVMYFYQISQPPAKTLYAALTEIKPIQIHEENKFELYNAYLKKFENDKSPYTIDENPLNIKKKKSKNYYNNFKNIDKESLINLYIDKLNEYSFHIDAIKKFGLLNKKNYLNDQDYENAVILNASKIQISAVKNELNHWNIKFLTYDLDKWIDYLNFIEKKVNQEIKSYLKNRLKVLIENEKKLRKYEIEDLEIVISNTLKNYENIDQKTSANELDKLKILKRSLLSKKDIERFEEIILASPISNSEEFFAAQLMISATKFEKVGRDKFSMKKTIILTGLLGIILGLIYVFLVNSIEVKREK